MPSMLVQALALMAFFAFCLIVVTALHYLARRYIEEEQDPDPAPFEVTRGRAIGTLSQAQRDLDRVAPPPAHEPRTLFLGGLWLPRSEETHHVLTLGLTGSGKSISAKIQLFAALRRILAPLIIGEQVGAIVYDSECSPA